MPSFNKKCILSQDEAIYKQLLFWSKYWTGPSEEKPLIPKNDSQGLMISAFVSREFGFVYELSPSQLKIVNKYRKYKMYCNEQPAIEKLGKIEKEDFEKAITI